MNKFLLFGGIHYEPHGGWEDFAGVFDAEADAVAAGVQRCNLTEDADDKWEWWHIVKLEQGGAHLAPDEFAIGMCLASDTRESP